MARSRISVALGTGSPCGLVQGQCGGGDRGQWVASSPQEARTLPEGTRPSSWPHYVSTPCLGAPAVN